MMDAIVKAQHGSFAFISMHPVPRKERIATKIHARVDAKGPPVCLLISQGETHGASCTDALLNGLENGAVFIADKAYDADNIARISVPNILTIQSQSQVPVDQVVLNFGKA